MIDLARLGKDPVRPDRPAGDDAKYDTRFDELQAEVQKSVSVIGGAPDWTRIALLASDILASASKDLVTAGYLAVALVYTRQAEGFVTGCGIMLDLIENYWNDGYPAKARTRGRSRAIAWWIEKSAEALKKWNGIALAADSAARLCERFETVHPFLRGQLEDCPSFAPLITLIRLAGERSLVQESGAAADRPRPANPAPRAARTPSELDVKRALNNWAEDSRRLSVLLSAQDLANPLVYRLNRLALWLGVNELPPATQGRTLLEPPEPRIVDRLRQLERAGDYPALLEAAEAEASRFIFWFDVQRYAAQALLAQGERFAAAAETVQQETRQFLHLLPGLEILSFSDGTPFADPQTILFFSPNKREQLSTTSTHNTRRIVCQN